jgi:serine/threonine-protein kinase HipA
MFGKTVGAMAYALNSPIATFEYSEEWLKSGIEISPIHLPLNSKKYTFPALPFPTFKGLPSVFADSLPDDFGNSLINSWLIMQGRDPDTFSALERLLYTGTRGIGALEFFPLIKESKPKTEKIHLESLVYLAQEVLNYHHKPRQQIPVNDKNFHQLLQIGTSAGGARSKAIIAISKDRKSIQSGQAHVPEGYDSCILKFDGIHDKNSTSERFGDPLGYGLMEYAYFLMAKDCGIPMMPCEILIEGPRSHFLTQRFDRIQNEKRHIISLCAMTHADFKSPGTFSYEEFFHVARKLKLSRNDAVQIYRQLTFNVIARNQDDHTKNFSFILDKNNKWRLAPAYDIAYSYKPGSPWVNSHQMTLCGKTEHFSMNDLKKIASQIANFDKEANQIIENTLDVVSQWPRYAKEAGVFPELTKLIMKNLRLNLK